MLVTCLLLGLQYMFSYMTAAHALHVVVAAEWAAGVEGWQNCRALHLLGRSMGTQWKALQLLNSGPPDHGAARPVMSAMAGTYLLSVEGRGSGKGQVLSATVRYPVCSERFLATRIVIAYMCVSWTPFPPLPMHRLLVYPVRGRASPKQLQLFSIYWACSWALD